MVKQIVFYGDDLDRLDKYESYVILEEKPVCSQWQERKQDTLFVFDDEELASTFMAADYYVVAYLHEENKHKKFFGVPYLIEKIQEIEPYYFRELFCRLAGIPLTVLETPRCTLREVTVEDVPRLYEIYGEESVVKYTEKLYNDIEEERAYIKNYIRNIYGFYGYGIWIIEEKNTERIIGRAGIEMAEATAELEMGFLIEKAYQRKGFAYEVCTAILEYVHNVLDERRVGCLIREGNTPSIELCKKLGFFYEGTKIENNESYLVYRLDRRTHDSRTL